MYIIPSGSDKKRPIDQQWARDYLMESLGYEDLNSVPVGKGNDYLSTLVAIASGRDFGDKEFIDIIAEVRNENNLTEGKQSEKIL